MSLDDENRITANFMMKEVTIFSRPEEVPVLQGKKIQEIDPQHLFPKNKSIQQALTLAMVNKG